MSKRPSNSAHRVQLMFCPDCSLPHLVLFDEDDEVIAQAVIDRDIAESIMAAVEASERSQLS